MPSTKMKLIDGESFTITQPYDEGHVCTAAEARSLNQTRSENIGNNLRSIVKEAKEKGTVTVDGVAYAVADLPTLVGKYDDAYSFSMPGAGSPVRRLDPVEREAKAIATELIKADLASKNRKWGQVPDGMEEAAWVEKRDNAVEALMAREDVLKLAKKRVAEKAKLGEGLTADL